MPAYEDSDLESVSTASCSDDDEIDEKAIRTMSCNFLQKKKSGVFEDIIAQKKASLHNMALLRQYSAMVSHQQGGGGGGGGFTNRQPSFARKSSNDDDTVPRRIPAPPSGSSISSSAHQGGSGQGLLRRTSNESSSVSPSTSAGGRGGGGDSSYASSMSNLQPRTSLSSTTDEVGGSSYPNTPQIIGSDPTSPSTKTARDSSTASNPRGRRHRTVGFGDGEEATAAAPQPPPPSAATGSNVDVTAFAEPPQQTQSSTPTAATVESPTGSLPAADSRGASWGNAEAVVSEAMAAADENATVASQEAPLAADAAPMRQTNRTEEETITTNAASSKTTTTHRTTRRTRGGRQPHQQEHNGVVCGAEGGAANMNTTTTTHNETTSNDADGQPIVDFNSAGIAAGPLAASSSVQQPHPPTDTQAETLKPSVSNVRRHRRGPQRQATETEDNHSTANSAPVAADADRGVTAVDATEDAQQHGAPEQTQPPIPTTEDGGTATGSVPHQDSTTASSTGGCRSRRSRQPPGGRGRSSSIEATDEAAAMPGAPTMEDGGATTSASGAANETYHRQVVEARDGESSKRTPPTAKASVIAASDSASDSSEHQETPAGDDVEQQRPTVVAAAAAVPSLMSLGGVGSQHTRTISPRLPKRMSTTPATSPPPGRIREDSDDADSGNNRPVKVTPLPKIDALSVVNMWGKSALGLGGLINLKKLAPPETTSPELSTAADQRTPQPPSDGKSSSTPRNSNASSSPSTWSKAAFLTGGRREGPDASGLIEDDPYGEEVGGSDETSREAILKKEKALQQRMKALKNLVAPASVSLSARGPAKSSPRQLASLAARHKI